MNNYGILWRIILYLFLKNEYLCNVINYEDG